MFYHNWRMVDRGQFLISVGQCLEKGYPLKLAIEIQSYQVSAYEKRQIDELNKRLSQGNDISHAIKDIGFPYEVAGYIRFSEEIGQLSQGFQESGTYLLQREKHKQKLQRMLRYPLLLFITSLIIGYMVIYYLVPRFATLVTNLSVSPPLITKLLISFGFFFQNHDKVLIITFLITLFFSYLYFKKLHPYKKIRLLLKVPVLNYLVRCQLTYFFSFHLGGMLKVGMSVQDAMFRFKDMASEGFYRHEGERLHQSLQGGGQLSDIISNSNHFLVEFPKIILNGQQTGLLASALQDYSWYILKKMEERTTTLITAIQPILIILFGLGAMLLYLSLLLPMFQIIETF